MSKRTALVLTLAAALVAAPPTAPLAPLAGDTGSSPAWGHYMNSTAMSIVSTFTCSLVPVGLGIGGAGGVIFGIACGVTAAA